MQKTADPFEFDYHGQRVQVRPRLVGRDLVYALYFEDGVHHSLLRKLRRIMEISFGLLYLKED